MPDQYEQEIEDILRQAEAEAPLPQPRSRQSLRGLVRQYARQSLNNNAWGISPGRIMLTALALILAAILLRPFLPSLFGLLAWAGLIIFIIAYGLFFVKPSRKYPPKKWRGRYVEDEPTNLFTSLKDKFTRRFKR